MCIDTSWGQGRRGNTSASDSRWSEGGCGDPKAGDVEHIPIKEKTHKKKKYKKNKKKRTYLGLETRLSASRVCVLIPSPRVVFETCLDTSQALSSHPGPVSSSSRVLTRLEPFSYV